MSFAENLKQLRKDKQLSQEELAEILDVSRQAVSMLNSQEIKYVISVLLKSCRSASMPP